jgi:hypothetical protein
VLHRYVLSPAELDWIRDRAVDVIRRPVVIVPFEPRVERFHLNRPHIHGRHGYIPFRSVGSHRAIWPERLGGPVLARRRIGMGMGQEDDLGELLDVEGRRLAAGLAFGRAACGAAK